MNHNKFGQRNTNLDLEFSSKLVNKLHRIHAIFLSPSKLPRLRRSIWKTVRRMWWRLHGHIDFELAREFYWKIPVCRKSVLYLNSEFSRNKPNLEFFFHYSQSNLSLTLMTKIPPQKIRMHKERNCRGHLNADPEKSTCILRLKLNDEWPPMPEKENEWMV